MSRVNGFYSPVHPDRVNPEFIGIGQKLSQHKRSRLDSDKNKQTIQSNYVFTLKLNQQLDRTLIEKQKQLERLQAARQRHHQDIKHKINEQDRRQRLLYELKQKSKQQRMTMTMGIKNAKRSLRNDRKAMKNATKQQLNGLRQLYKTQNQAFKNQQHMKYRSVEMGKKAGNQRVNEYYRSKNKQSYNNYLKMIENQDKKSEQNFNEIRYMNQHMKKLEKKIEKKQHKLREVVDQIGLYAIQCQNQRKVNFLATYSTSRPNHSSSSWRSKPTDVLRSSMNKHKMQEAF